MRQPTASGTAREPSMSSTARQEEARTQALRWVCAGFNATISRRSAARLADLLSHEEAG